MLAAVRAFFAERGVLEVETPALSWSGVTDPALESVRATVASLGGSHYLHTSPEFAMKRLLAAGSGDIYELCRVFRDDELGRWHQPEFTLLEWYRVGDDYQAGMQLLAELAAAVLDVASAAVERITYRAAFERFTGGPPPADDVAADTLLVQRVQPRLGAPLPVIVHDYPAAQAALARTRGSVAERFELFYRGVELANGYHELLDPAVLRARQTENNALRVRDGKLALPEDNRLLAAMEHGLPACSGCALGVDRLLMALTGANSIADVLAFPSDRA